MQLHFYKYHGTGNDFVIIDGWRSHPQLTYQQIKWICDRHFGIGADGLMIIRRHPELDFEMLYYNSDGHPGTMCGNGSRCLVALAWEKGYCNSPCDFIAPDGIHNAKRLENGWVSVSMRDISLIEKKDSGDYVLDTGSPHYVVWADPAQTDVVKAGRAIRNAAEYRKDGINVNFVSADSASIKLRTYERGVEDETLSCGTGITASVIAAAASGRIDASIEKCDVNSEGGSLRVLFRKNGKGYTGIRLEGPAEKVFEGIIQI